MHKSLLAILLFAVTAPLHASEWSGNLNFFLGGKTLDENDWSPVEQQGEFGILVDYKKQDWPVSIAIDLLGSSDDSTFAGFKVEGKTSELDFGVRKVWEFAGQPIHPFVGGGLGLIGAEYQVGPLSDSDTSLGVWLNGGVYWTIGEHFNLGLEARYSQAEVTMFNVNGEAGGSHGGLLLGYHW